MHYEPDQLYHVYNRGNNRQQLFFTPEHYLLFLRKLREGVRPHAAVLAYCLMPNHFHLLLVPSAEGTRRLPTPSSNKQWLTRGFAVALSSYTQALNKQLHRTGSMFQPKTQACLVTDWQGRYPRTCFHYLHQNPVRAHLVPRLEDWPYSSYRDFAGLRSGTFCNQALATSLFDLPLSTPAFREESESLLPPDLGRPLLYPPPPVR